MVTPRAMSQRMREVISSGDVDALARVISQGEDPNAIDERSGWSALMLAAEHDQPQVLEVLLAAGADPRHASPNGWTALHHAVDAECDAESQGAGPATGRLVAPLIAAGANPDAIWSDAASKEVSPRAIAFRYGNEVVASALRR